MCAYECVYGGSEVGGEKVIKYILEIIDRLVSAITLEMSDAQMKTVVPKATLRSINAI